MADNGFQGVVVTQDLTWDSNNTRNMNFPTVYQKRYTLQSAVFLNCWIQIWGLFFLRVFSFAPKVSLATWYAMLRRSPPPLRDNYVQLQVLWNGHMLQGSQTRQSAFTQATDFQTGCHCVALVESENLSFLTRPPPIGHSYHLFRRCQSCECTVKLPGRGKSLEPWNKRLLTRSFQTHSRVPWWF